VNEFTQILTLARQYEMQVKLMKTADENATASAQLLQMS
jgi:flagellar basal-body rod protein FlgF